jgi:hypothetical protein
MVNFKYVFVTICTVRGTAAPPHTPTHYSFGAMVAAAEAILYAIVACSPTPNPDDAFQLRIRFIGSITPLHTGGRHGEHLPVARFLSPNDLDGPAKSMCSHLISGMSAT